MVINEKYYCDSCLETLAEGGEAQTHFQVLSHPLGLEKHVCMNCGEYEAELEELGFHETCEFDECDEV